MIYKTLLILVKLIKRKRKVEILDNLSKKLKKKS